MSNGINNIGGNDLRALELLRQSDQTDAVDQHSALASDQLQSQANPSTDRQADRLDDGEHVLLASADAAGGVSEPGQRTLLDGSIHVPSNISATSQLHDAVANAAAFITTDV